MEDKMKQILAKVGLAAALAVAALSGTVTNAAAQGVDIYVGPRPVYPPPPAYGRPPPPPPGYGRPPAYGGGYGYGGGPRGCNPRMAEDIARDYGLRRAHVVDITPRRVIVDGYGRHGPDTIVFANVRGCPMMGR
jgi:hypothetical protein